ncbi:MAG: methyltransferase domain-containing protein [Bacteroidetes bacterium]|nr:MAG: methyltransferase domain-containing protein [Bacteroidota bacterium]
MSVFKFKEFIVRQDRSALKVGTDAMILGSLITRNVEGKALDIGAGTGVLSLMVAQMSPTIYVTGVEIDADSYTDCKENFERSPFNDRLKAIQGDYKDVQGEYDLIFCNPPFYLNGLISDNHKINQAKHSDVAFVAELFSYVKYHLGQHGEFWCIYPFEHRPEILKVAFDQGFNLSIDYSVNSKKDIKSRSVMCFKKEGSTIQERIITLRNSNGTYTEQYKILTKEFHGKAL